MTSIDSETQPNLSPLLNGDIGSERRRRWDKILFQKIRRDYRTEDKLFCPECRAQSTDPCGVASMPGEYALQAMVEVARSGP
jgi:hypothetical protein